MHFRFFIAPRSHISRQCFCRISASYPSNHARGFHLQRPATQPSLSRLRRFIFQRGQVTGCGTFDLPFDVVRSSSRLFGAYPFMLEKSPYYPNNPHKAREWGSLLRAFRPRPGLAMFLESAILSSARSFTMRELEGHFAEAGYPKEALTCTHQPGLLRACRMVCAASLAWDTHPHLTNPLNVSNSSNANHQNKPQLSFGVDTPSVTAPNSLNNNPNVPKNLKSPIMYKPQPNLPPKEQIVTSKVTSQMNDTLAC
jgi:hypothetical protein